MASQFTNLITQIVSIQIAKRIKLIEDKMSYEELILEDVFSDCEITESIKNDKPYK